MYDGEKASYTPDCDVAVMFKAVPVVPALMQGGCMPAVLTYKFVSWANDTHDYVRVRDRAGVTYTFLLSDITLTRLEEGFLAEQQAAAAMARMQMEEQARGAGLVVPGMMPPRGNGGAGPFSR